MVRCIFRLGLCMGLSKQVCPPQNASFDRGQLQRPSPYLIRSEP